MKLTYFCRDRLEISGFGLSNWRYALRWMPVGMLLACVAHEGFGANLQPQCERMAQNLARMEQRSVSPTQMDRARKQYESRCGAAPSDGGAANPGPAADGRSFEKVSEPDQRPSPPVSFLRSKTEGSFVDWERELNSKCDNSTADGRTRCAQVKIDRSVKEGRLSAEEVEACAPADPGPGRARQRSSTLHESQARRQASLGGDAYWKWSPSGGCKLVERVKQTFAGTVAPRAEPIQTPRTEPAHPASVDPNRIARACSFDADHPECRAASRTPQQRRFTMWSSGEYSRCAQESAPGQARDRDYCARTLVEQASSLGMVSKAAIEHCRTQWTQGARDRSEHAAIHLCLEQSAHMEEMLTSRILRMESSPAYRPTLPTQGYRQPSAIAGLHAGAFNQVPSTSGDGPYFIQLLGHLEQACPNLGLVATQLQLVQHLWQRQQDVMARAARNQATREEAQMAVSTIAVGLMLAENCNDKDSHEERQRCEQGKTDLMTLPESRDAVHDVALLVKRHTCTGSETRRFAGNLGNWLLMSPAKRAPLAWAAGLPQQAQYQAMFDNCRRQAGDGAADAWCGCYVQRFSQTQSGTRAHPATHAATAGKTAFVDDNGTWFVPSELGACDPYLEELKGWRRAQPLEKATACLIGQSPVALSVTPELQACSYRTAWGEIEYRNKECRPRLLARFWGSETVQCN